eukprot:6312913-Pyramimonas_sp.AAC.1
MSTVRARSDVRPRCRRRRGGAARGGGGWPRPQRCLRRLRPCAEQHDLRPHVEHQQRAGDRASSARQQR